MKSNILKHRNYESLITQDLIKVPHKNIYGIKVKHPKHKSSLTTVKEQPDGSGQSTA